MKIGIVGFGWVGMIDCDAVVVTAGRGGNADESRLELLRDNAAIIASTARELSE